MNSYSHAIILCHMILSLPVLLLAINGSTVNRKECGIFRSKAEPKVIGGVDADIEEFPWQVSLQRITLGSIIPLPEWRHLCGATIINNLWILTAAHCVEGLLTALFPSQLRAVMGTHLWRVPLFRNTAQIISISEIIVHDKWNRAEGHHDIALLKLSRRIEFNSKVNSICLQSDDINSTKDVSLSGWGLTSDRAILFNDLPNRLQKIEIPVVDANRCAQIYSKENYEITDSMICAGFYRDGYCYGAYTGDSGGALVTYIDNVAYHAGIVSFALPCRRYKAPDVYTKTSKYIKWIEKVTQNS